MAMQTTSSYISFKVGASENIVIENIEKCMAAAYWILCHKRKINDSKTEVYIFGTPQQLTKISTLSKITTTHINSWSKQN